MTVTTVDIPKELLQSIDGLVQQKRVRNRREVIVRALETFMNLQVYRWTSHRIYINGIRKAIVSKGSLSELESGLSDEDLYDAGRRMGKTLRDMGIEQKIDVSLPKNHKAALRILENEGWGGFSVDDERITVTNPVFLSPLMHGYLESALSIRLSVLDTTEDILVFAKVGVRDKSRKNSSRKRQDP